MTSLEEFGEDFAPTRRPDDRRKRVRPPQGFEPGVRYDPSTRSGTLVSEPAESEPLWDDVFRHFGLDPAEYEVIPPVEMRSWESWAKDDGELVTRWLYYYRARFQARSVTPAGLPIDDLVAGIRRDKPPQKLYSGDCGLVVNVADWQAGKRDGDGTVGLVGRARCAIAELEQRVKQLRKVGVPVGVIYIAGVGDLIEGCDNHYAMQCFGVELNRRDQVKLARRLIKELVRKAARLCERVVVVAVGGNHGENRRDGRAFTDFADNDDVALFEQIAEALAENPDAYGHVEFVLPNDELTVTLDVCGTIVTWAHGHQFGSGSTPEQKARGWLSSQALNKRAAGECDLLISAHYHHLRVAQWGPTGWVQCPALDGGSEWWVNRTGEDSPPGVLTLAVGRDVSAAGWGHLATIGETVIDT